LIKKKIPDLTISKRLRHLFCDPLFPLVITPIILLSPVLLTGKALFWGTPATQFVPWWKWSFDVLLSGHLPLWNPLVGMGAPLIANYQSALFYPPNLVYFLFYLLGGISSLAWSQALVLTGHLIFAAVGMSILTRRLGFGKLAQTVSGLAFGLSGYYVAHAWFSSLNAAIAWFPWILLISLEMIIGKKKSTSRIKLGLVLGLQLLAGHAQTSWYSWLFITLWVGFWTWQVNLNGGLDTIQRISKVIKSWGYLALSIILGVGIAAIQLLPTAEYLLQSQRASSASFESTMTYSLWPWRLLGLIAPNLFGSPVTSDFWGYGNYWEDSLYIGVLPFILAVGILLKRKNFAQGKLFTQKKGNKILHLRSKITRLRFFLVVIILLSVLLALGKNTPIFPWLYHNIPTFNMFRAPTRFSIWMIFSLTLLAGIGIENWNRPEGRGLYWTRLGTAGAFAVSLGAGIGSYLLIDVGVDLNATFVPAIAMAGLWGFGAGVLSLTAPIKGDEKKDKRTLWQLGVVIWVSVDLLVAGWGLNPGISLDFYKVEPKNYLEIKHLVGNGRMYLNPDDEYRIRFEDYFRFESFESRMGWENLRSTFLPNLNMLEGIPVINNYDPLVPARYSRWMDEIEVIDYEIKNVLLNQMGVSVLERRSEVEGLGIWLFLRDEYSRVSWVPCGQFASDDESAWDLVFSGEIDLSNKVVLEGQGPIYLQDCNPSNGNPRIISEHPNEIVIIVDADSPGWLVLSDVWYPGWSVTVDGESTTIMRANYLFRSIAIPQGAHEIIFSYQPSSFIIGVVITLTTCIGLGGFVKCKLGKGVKSS